MFDKDPPEPPRHRGGPARAPGGLRRPPGLPQPPAGPRDFPDDFVFMGTRGDVRSQIGNVVPPPLARAIGEEILRVLRVVDGLEPESEGDRRLADCFGLQPDSLGSNRKGRSWAGRPPSSPWTKPPARQDEAPRPGPRARSGVAGGERQVPCRPAKA
ncbi:MAG: DNA cytosine methyltransferase [Gemmatimonadota bacterium]|nr:DNA cytosine methyltransferase [Gemmatimonadota bacterium]